MLSSHPKPTTYPDTWIGFPIDGFGMIEVVVGSMASGDGQNIDNMSQEMVAVMKQNGNRGRDSGLGFL